MYPFSDVVEKTFYITTSGLNLNESHDDLKDSNILNEIILGRNQINIMDMYRQDIIGKDFYKYGRK